MTEVVGRDRELGELARLLDRDDPTTVCVVTAGPGAGKSTLLDAVVAEASRRDHLVLDARPRAAEQVLSFSVLADLLSAAPVAELPEEQRAVLQSALGTTAVARPVDPRLVAVAVREVLSLAALVRPVLVAIDDAHWADDASRVVLPHAFRRVAGGPVSLLVATRPDGREDPWPTGPQRQDLTLQGLSSAALFQLVRNRLGTSLGRGDLVRLERVSHGNPMYALELAAAWTGTDDRSTLLTPTLEDLVASQVRRLGASVRRMLLTAALASDPTAHIVAAAAGIDDLDAALGAAEPVAGLRVGRVRFRHPLHAAAVIADAAPEERRAAHAALAGVETGTEVVARHLADAAEGPQPATADLLDEAARQARTRGAHPIARELLGRAVELTPPDASSLDERRLRLAAWALHDGDPQTCAEMAGAVVARGGPLADRALLLQARRAALVDGMEQTRELAHALLDRSRDPLLRAGALLAVADATGELSSAREVALQALDELTEAGGDPGEVGPLRTAVTTALARYERTLRMPGAADRLRTAVRLEQRHPTESVADSARFAAAQEDLFASRLPQARATFTELLAQCRAHGDEASEPLLLLNLGHLETRAGAFDAAGRYARDGLAVAELTGQAAWTGLALLQIAADDARLGDDDTADARLAQADKLLAPFADPWLLAIRHAVNGRVQLVRGDPQTAAALLRPIAALSRRGDLHDTGWNPYPGDLAEALLAIGDLDGAEAELARILRGADGQDRPHVQAAALRVQARLAAERSAPADGLPLALEAVAVHERLGLQFDVAHSLLVAGILHRRARQKAAAHRLLEQAVARFTACRTPRWAARAAAELARVGLRPSAPHTLTPTEDRVARLAAAGRTNREIAAEVFASPKTVEAVLGRVYRKLGVRSRVELVTALTAVDAEATTP